MLITLFIALTWCLLIPFINWAANDCVLYGSNKAVPLHVLRSNCLRYINLNFSLAIYTLLLCSYTILWLLLSELAKQAQLNPTQIQFRIIFLLNRFQCISVFMYYYSFHIKHKRLYSYNLLSHTSSMQALLFLTFIKTRIGFYFTFKFVVVLRKLELKTE